MSGVRVFRVQDARGKGPFQPGFSRFWADAHFAPGMKPLPTWMEEFGADLVDKSSSPDEHVGSAVRTLSDIGKWFSASERARLESLGFNVVALNVGRVLAESENQLVFARSAPCNRGATLIAWAAVP